MFQGQRGPNLRNLLLQSDPLELHLQYINARFDGGINRQTASCQPASGQFRALPCQWKPDVIQARELVDQSGVISKHGVKVSTMLAQDRFLEGAGVSQIRISGFNPGRLTRRLKQWQAEGHANRDHVAEGRLASPIHDVP